MGPPVRDSYRVLCLEGHAEMREMFLRAAIGETNQWACEEASILLALHFDFDLNHMDDQQCHFPRENRTSFLRFRTAQFEGHPGCLLAIARLTHDRNRFAQIE